MNTAICDGGVAVFIYRAFLTKKRRLRSLLQNINRIFARHAKSPAGLVMSRWPRKPSRSLLRGKSSLPNQNVLQHCFCKSCYKTFVNTFLLLTAFTVECFFALLYVNILIIWFSAVFANKHCIFRALPMVGFFRYLKHLIPPGTGKNSSEVNYIWMNTKITNDYYLTRPSVMEVSP